MLAHQIDTEKYDVAIFEKNNTFGRKFLVAGEGGFNLTHSEAPENFIRRYKPREFIVQAFDHFNNHDMIRWLNANGIETFAGSSGRIFPKKGLKPIDVLNVFLEKIKKRGVVLHNRFEWKGFSSNRELLFETNGVIQSIKSDLNIFCLGGASWPVTGSTGTWTEFFRQKNIQVEPFEASNCTFIINWPKSISSGKAGKALKNCAFSCEAKTQIGEAVLTGQGIEGSGVYPLSPEIRNQLHKNGKAILEIDLKPALSVETILSKIKSLVQGESYTTSIAKQLNLSQTQITLIKFVVTKEEFLVPELLANHIKKLKLVITGLGPIDEAISTTGGISLNEINNEFELVKMLGNYVIGEMLNYDAPTGGYLLQSCFTMAKNIADNLNSKK